MINNLDDYFIKAGNKQSVSSWLRGNLWCWLSPAQLEDLRSADVTMGLEGISSDKGTPKASERSGMRVPEKVLKVRPSFILP